MIGTIFDIDMTGLGFQYKLFSSLVMNEADDPGGRKRQKDIREIEEMEKGREGSIKEKAFHYFALPQSKDLDLYFSLPSTTNPKNKPFPFLHQRQNAVKKNS